MDLQNLVGEVMVEIDAKAKEKNLHVQVGTTPIPKVFADPNKVHQILLNLLGNALKFTKDSGTISISYFNDGYSVEVSIHDDGIRISSEDLPRLFKKSSRLDNSYVAASSTGGTGLGLFICKSLVEMMKGKIWAKSDGVNKGTTFVFSLPSATPQVLKEAEKYHYKPDGEARLLEPVAIQAYPNEPMDVILKA
jgi:signal transduction histidine kinase